MLPVLYAFDTACLEAASLKTGDVESIEHDS